MHDAYGNLQYDAMQPRSTTCIMPQRMTWCSRNLSKRQTGDFPVVRCSLDQILRRNSIALPELIEAAQQAAMSGCHRVLNELASSFRSFVNFVAD